MKKKPKRSPTDILKAIRESARKKTLRFAPQKNVARYEEEIHEFLDKVLAVNCYMVTDLSCIRDFSPFKKHNPKAWKAKIVAKTKKLYGKNIAKIFDEPLADVVAFISQSRN